MNKGYMLTLTDQTRRTAVIDLIIKLYNGDVSVGVNEKYPAHLWIWANGTELLDALKAVGVLDGYQQSVISNRYEFYTQPSFAAVYDGLNRP